MTHHSYSQKYKKEFNIQFLYYSSFELNKKTLQRI